MKTDKNDNYITSFEFANDMEKCKKELDLIIEKLEKTNITNKTLDFVWNDQRTSFALHLLGCEVERIREKMERR